MSIQHSVIEQFHLDGQGLEVYIYQGDRKCIVAKDVYKAVGYGRKAGVQADTETCSNEVQNTIWGCKIIIKFARERLS